MGLSNFLASLNSIMGPLIVGWIVTDSVREDKCGQEIKVREYFSPFLFSLMLNCGGSSSF